MLIILFKERCVSLSEVTKIKKKRKYKNISCLREFDRAQVIYSNHFPRPELPKCAVPFLCLSVGTRLELVGEEKGCVLMTPGTIFYVAFSFCNAKDNDCLFLVIELQRSKMRFVTFNKNKFSLSAKALKTLLTMRFLDNL